MENGLEFLLHSMNKIRTIQLFKVFITSTKHCEFKRHRRRHGGWVQNLMQVKKSGEALHSVFYYNLTGWTCCVLLGVHVFSGSYLQEVEKKGIDTGVQICGTILLLPRQFILFPQFPVVRL